MAIGKAPSETRDVQLEGKVGLVTGGHRGIGKAIVERLQQAGATVISCGRTLPPDADPAQHLVCDVRDAQACSDLIAAIVKRHGRLDLLVNNAGGSPEAVAATVSANFTRRVIALNLLAPINLSQAALPHLNAGCGSIVNIASVSALRPSPGTAAYAAAKAGLLAYGSSVAHEWGPNVRVNAVVVGYVETEAAYDTYGTLTAREEISATLAARRLARPDEIAQVVAFLASDAASYVTGAAINVDGGGEGPAFLGIVRRHSTVE